MTPAKAHRRLVDPDNLPEPQLRAVAEVAGLLLLLAIGGAGIVAAVLHIT